MFLKVHSPIYSRLIVNNKMNTCTLKSYHVLQRAFCCLNKKVPAFFSWKEEILSAKVVNCTWMKWRTLIFPTHLFWLRVFAIFAILCWVLVQTLLKCSCRFLPMKLLLRSLSSSRKAYSINLFSLNAWQIEFCGFVFLFTLTLLEVGKHELNSQLNFFFVQFVKALCRIEQKSFDGTQKLAKYSLDWNWMRLNKRKFFLVFLPNRFARKAILFGFYLI